MPIRPQPMRVSCPHCHWHTISAPRSDAISPGEWVTQCPRCGHDDLERTPLSSWQASLVLEHIAPLQSLLERYQRAVQWLLELEEKTRHFVVWMPLVGGG